MLSLVEYFCNKNEETAENTNQCYNENLVNKYRALGGCPHAKAKGT